MLLDDKERAVIETVVMRCHYQDSLTYLKERGMEMSTATYYRFKKRLEAKRHDRMQWIADHFGYLHLEKIDKLHLVEKMMWE